MRPSSHAMKASWMVLALGALLAVGAGACDLQPKGPTTDQSSGRLAFYVSTTGNDSSDGLSAKTAFRTLPRAVAAISASGGRPTLVYISGNFVLGGQLRLTKADGNSHWTVQPGKSAIIRGSGDACCAFSLNGADDVEISGLELDDFKSSGIFVQNSHGVEIAHNVIKNIRSSAWNQAAIAFLGDNYGAHVIDNVIKGAGYIGIMIATDARSDVSYAVITGNKITDTCQSVKDCGAIYINDRGRKSRGSIIEDNDIANFGPPATTGAGIYLDDWASNVTVRGNHISGPGTYAFVLHGGSGNLIEDNVVDMRKIKWLALNESRVGENTAKMTGNIFDHNRFHFKVIPADLLGAIRKNDNQMPSLKSNVVCSTSSSADRCTP